jgi:hypothetical protein
MKRVSRNSIPYLMILILLSRPKSNITLRYTKSKKTSKIRVTEERQIAIKEN